ncbi:hypothetical protein GDO81_004528 [Engystomops pustulosus]|uniref:Uncharacterized protein n=1 Tax=Engystomops pustulosus TaxID=76066 RepID=A0AAV6ZTP5_ENGPU|nr:hypothetical protein GDO81_004528 [Engystomops pustulosus]
MLATDFSISAKLCKFLSIPFNSLLGPASERDASGGGSFIGKSFSLALLSGSGANIDKHGLDGLEERSFSGSGGGGGVGKIGNGENEGGRVGAVRGGGGGVEHEGFV